MKFPEDIHASLARRYKKNYSEWLERLDEKLWPFEISLGMPTEFEAKQQFERVRHWVNTWRSLEGFGTLIWSERQWRTLGNQQLPDKLRFDTPEILASSVGELEQWKTAKFRYQKLVESWPELNSRLSRYIDSLIDFREADFQRFFQVLKWLNANPNSNLYPRQLPITGVDGKWLECHRKILCDLISIIHNADIKTKNFLQYCGLKSLPHLIRLRMLDDSLRKAIGGLSDICVSPEELSLLDLPVFCVYIVENLQTGLAFPEIPGSLVIMGLGYHVDVLARVSWLNHVPCFYWGDLDTHGFAILHRVRSYLPQVQSLLMDVDTLLKHSELWGRENLQHSGTDFDLLSQTEQIVYKGLKQQIWGQNVRLEQERIDWEYAIQTLNGNF